MTRRDVARQRYWCCWWWLWLWRWLPLAMMIVLLLRDSLLIPGVAATYVSTPNAAAVAAAAAAAAAASYMPSIVSPAISVRPSTTDAVALIQSTRITSKQSRRSLGLHRPAPRDTWLTRLSQRLFRTAECVSVQSEVHYESVHRKTEVVGEDRVPVNWYERSKCVYIIHINVVAKKDGSKPRYLHCNNVYQLLFWGTVLPGATKMLQCFLFQHENRNIHVVHEYFFSPNILCLFRTYVFANLFIFIPFI